jgi:hypothetical protein
MWSVDVDILIVRSCDPRCHLQSDYTCFSCLENTNPLTTHDFQSLNGINSLVTIYVELFMLVLCSCDPSAFMNKFLKKSVE